MKPKPAYGEQCNGCGQCCIKYLCPVAKQMFGGPAPCPALEQDGDEYRCGLIRSPRRYAPVRAAAMGEDALREHALVLMGAGTGCCAIFAGERKNQAYLESKLEETERASLPPSPRFVRAALAWDLA